MIVLYTTERDYPWGTLRSTHASKTKVVLEVDAMKLDATPKVDAYLKRLRERPSYRSISPRTKVAEASSRA